MDSTIIAKANEWLNSNIDDQSKNEIRSMLDAGDGSTDLVDAFYKDLEFGTGGLRGIMGVGSNRMNKYTVGKATQGLSNYLLKAFPNEEIKVAIAHDSRNNSPFFAETTASVFSANGIKVYFFEALRPTPELSYAIRHLGCKSGVVVTASHNPKEYNGYKAYWDDGAQVVPPHDKNIIEEVNAIASIDDVKFDNNDALIEKIGADIDEAYLNEVKKLSINPEVIKRQADLKIVYSSIHGTGITMVPKSLEMFGFKNVTIVEEQAEPNGNFPTVVYPNPEESEAMSIALNKAKEIDADIVMATDPDSDRVGIGVKNHKGEFQLLNGNQTGALLIYYMLQAWKDANKLDGNQYIVKTVVTTELITEIAKGLEVEMFNTLTGFKYIAGVIRELEGKRTYIVGGEESYGYLIGEFVRDKDAVASCAMIAEMTAWAKDKGMTLFDLLIGIYNKYGFYKESLISITKKGKEGADAIQAMMKNMRENPPATISGSKLVKKIDYLSGKEKNMQTGSEVEIDFPESNVLQFITEDGSKISARPSGTEPKIKFYFGVKEELSNKSDFDSVNEKLDLKIKSIVEDLGLN